MFCGKCGTEVKDGDLFCPGCGEKTGVPDNSDTGVSSVKFNPKKLIIPAAGAVGVIGIIILIVCLVSSGGYKKTVDNYFKAYENNDPDLMYSKVVARYWIDYFNEGWGESAYSSIEGSIEDQLDTWGCGDDVEIDYEITGKERATKEELEELEDVIYDWYAYYVYDREDFEITDAYRLDIDFTVKGDGRTVNRYFPDGLLLIKENGKWRITRGYISCSFYSN